MADSPQANAVALTLPAPDLAQLGRGFAYIFWGQLALWMAGLELLLHSAAWLTGLFGLFGVTGTLGGAWVLTQATGLGPAWRRHTGTLLVVGVLLAYLSPFVWMWRQVPQSAYLLGHALTWWWMELAYVVVLNACLRAAAKANGDHGLGWQATVIGAAAYLLLVGPYSVVVLALVETGRRQGDSLGAIRFLLEHLHPIAVFALLTPLALTLSLVWSVKGWAFRRLTMPAPTSIVEPPRT